MQYHKIENTRLGEVVYAGEHKSGLGVFVIPKKGFYKKYAIFGTRYGSMDNRFVPLGESNPILVPDGVAHFLEHKMFEQPDGGNAFDAFAKYGANANAFTSFTNTCYLFSCTNHFNENPEHLISYVQTPYFTEENVSKEQGIIGQEIRMYDDDPQWQVTFQLLKAIYHNNPVNIDIAGTVESIAQIDKDVLYRCYNSFYNPGNMVLCVAGDVDVDEVFAIADRTVRADGPTGAVKSIYPDEPDAIVQKRIEQSLAVSIPMFNIGFKDNHLQTGREFLKYELGTNLLLRLIAGHSSDLYCNLYEQGLVNAEFGTDLMMEPQYSCAIIGGESEHPDQVVERVMEAISSMRKNGIDKTAFERAKRAALGSFLRSFNDVEDIATMYCRNILNGVDVMDFPSVYDQIDLGFLTQRLQEVFREENMAVSLITQ